MITDDDTCPVPDELIGRLYRSSQHDINELVSSLSSSRRGSLAAFCYGRAHLRDIGLAIAATCDLETLVGAGGRVGNFLYDQSRELPNVEKPRSKQAKVSLAPVNFSSAETAPNPVTVDAVMVDAVMVDAVTAEAATMDAVTMDAVTMDAVTAEMNAANIS